MARVLMPIAPGVTGAHCQLQGPQGTYRWRVDPNNVSWAYQVDTAVIDTLGGQVVQILGATLSDLVISGDFGHQWAASNGSRDSKQSWLLANGFHKLIKGYMDAQMSIRQPPMKNSTQGGHKIKAEGVTVSNPLKFSYRDGVHNWHFDVLVKALADGVGDGSAIYYSNGRFNHTYQLTLFIVQAESDAVKTITKDKFLDNIAKGIGWKKSQYHGPYDMNDVTNMVVSNGGYFNAMLAKLLGGETLTVPSGKDKTADPGTATNQDPSRPGGPADRGPRTGSGGSTPAPKPGTRTGPN